MTPPRAASAVLVATASLACRSMPDETILLATVLPADVVRTHDSRSNTSRPPAM